MVATTQPRNVSQRFEDRAKELSGPAETKAYEALRALHSVGFAGHEAERAALELAESWVSERLPAAEDSESDSKGSA